MEFSPAFSIVSEIALRICGTINTNCLRNSQLVCLDLEVLASLWPDLYRVPSLFQTLELGAQLNPIAK